MSALNKDKLREIKKELNPFKLKRDLKLNPVALHHIKCTKLLFIFDDM